jgi:hypothetical protein
MLKKDVATICYYFMKAALSSLWREKRSGQDMSSPLSECVALHILPAELQGRLFFLIYSKGKYLFS